MKYILLILISIVSIRPAAYSQVINSVWVKFTTTSDDKDWDSFIRFQVQDADGAWLASREGTFNGSFPDGSTYTFELNMGSPNYPVQFLNNSYFHMYMAPVGSDTWNFQWELTFILSDGRRLMSSGSGSLSDERQTFKLGPLFKN